jgi:isopenicillin N synthase-like dioxygenase
MKKTPIKSTIPNVDYRDFSDEGPRRSQFIETVGRALADFGFVAINNHGIRTQLLDKGYALAREVFGLPDDVKRKYETPHNGRQRGYTPFGIEHAKNQASPDLKEFWHVGRTLTPEHPLRASGEVPANEFPTEVPEFAKTFRTLFASFETFAGGLLEAVGEFLGKPEDYFADLTRDGNSVLRIIHYPDQGGAVPPGAVRAAAHEDINLLTVLPASTRPGLELLLRDGTWLPVETPPDVMICDTGDMMQLVTAGDLPATTHRVVNPEGSDGGRLSMPFFLHPHPHAMLQPSRPDYAPAVRTKDFLFERLRAIGVA